MAETEEADGYYVGMKAWDAYLDKLRELQDADEQTRNESMVGNSWIYECLAQYRKVAALFLRAVADEFDAETSERLLRAADLYERMSNGILQDEEHCLIAIAPLPWSLGEGETWTNAMRQAQIERLEAALLLEREAIQELKAALGSLSGA
jgi:hypothetical protein